MRTGLAASLGLNAIAVRAIGRAASDGKGSEDIAATLVGIAWLATLWSLLT